ncbi:MAG: 4Fe-4S binding protein [Anaerolineae bacterium]
MGLAHVLAARQAAPGLLIGAALALAFALCFGRAWCGWLCPLGTVLDWAPARKVHPRESDIPSRWRQVKHFLLALIVILAVFGNLSFLILDPLTLLYRPLATVLWPAAHALLWQIELLVYHVPLLQGVIDAIEATRGIWLPLAQPVYPAGLVIALLFGGVLALNAIRPRFWCRYLCPLGALLGLVSKAAWLRRVVGDTCIDCGRCARACPMGTIDPARGYASDPAECTMCLECVPVCARVGQHFWGHWRCGMWQPAPWQPYDPSRRQFLAAAGGGALAALGLFAIEPSSRRSHPRLIRPPGAFDPAFTAGCIRCGLCVKACPTAGLQPSLGEAGLAGLWTPVLVLRLGHCDYSCNLCGQVCPTAAIPSLPLAEKRLMVMGHAYIDRDRCIPWIDQRVCLVCEEMGPLPEKAIRLEEVVTFSADGTESKLPRPYVLRDLCIGCGICENRCPLAGEAAIRVYAVSFG